MLLVAGNPDTSSWIAALVSLMVGNKDKYEFERVFFGSFEALLSDGSAAFPEQASSEEVDSRLFYAPCLYTASPMSKLCKGSVSVFCEHMQAHTDTQPNSQTKTKQSMTMERMDATRNRVCNRASQTASGFFRAKRRTAKKLSMPQYGHHSSC